ncbi:MAG: OmpA family protein [bacterium]
MSRTGKLIFAMVMMCAWMFQSGCFVTTRRYQDDTKKLEGLMSDRIKDNKQIKKEYTRLSEEKDKLQKENTLLSSALDAKEESHANIVADLNQENSELAVENKGLRIENADLREKIVNISQEKKKEISTLKQTYNSLVTDMQDEIEGGKIKINQLENELSVVIVDKILFDSGDVKVKQEGQKLLERLGNVLKKVKDKQVQIEGHTDNVPIVGELTSKYPTNWELSAARAINVAKYLEDKVGMDPARLVACAYSEYRPISDNRTAQGRADNRRIEIVLVPMSVEAVEVEDGK